MYSYPSVGKPAGACRRTNKLDENYKVAYKFLLKDKRAGDTAASHRAPLIEWERGVGASEFFLGFICNCLSYFTPAKISFTSIIHSSLTWLRQFDSRHATSGMSLALRVVGSVVFLTIISLETVVGYRKSGYYSCFFGRCLRLHWIPNSAEKRILLLRGVWHCIWFDHFHCDTWKYSVDTSWKKKARNGLL